MVKLFLNRFNNKAGKEKKQVKSSAKGGKILLPGKHSETEVKLRA
jgi:hypothetical protein